MERRIVESRPRGAASAQRGDTVSGRPFAYPVVVSSGTLRRGGGAAATAAEPSGRRSPAAILDAAGTRGTWAVVLALSGVAALLRFPTLGLQSFDVDEGATLYVIRGSFGHTLHGVALHESTPPLYYVLAWLWSQAFGSGEAGLRSLSAVAGVALVPVVYAIGIALGARRIGLIAAAVVATSPYLVFYSQEARSYALFALLSTAALLCCVRAIREPGPRAFALWAVVSYAALATHYFAVFPLIGQIAALAVFGARRRLLAWSVAATAVASVPLLVLALHQKGAGHAAWIGASSLTQRVRVTVETFALGATFKGTLPHWVLAACATAAVAIAAAIAVASFFLVRRTTAAERRAGWIVGVVAALAIVLPLVGAAGYIVDRNLIAVLPVLALVLALGLGCAGAGRLGAAGAAVVVAGGVALTVLSFAVAPMRRPDVRQVSRWLGRPSQARVLVFVPRWRILLQTYQGTLADLPVGGVRVRDVEVFTAGDSIPAGTMPAAFRPAGVRHGDTFTLFDFRSRVPQRVTAADLGRHVFAESGLQPVAVLETP